MGVAFVNDLIASNWRFANLRDIRDAAAEINEVPVRKGWNRRQLTAAIEKIIRCSQVGWDTAESCLSQPG